MRILSLDLGDRWIGIAIADPLGITCKPYKTVERIELFEFLKNTIQKENITHIVVGCPKTLSGTDSAQTTQTIKDKELLEKKIKNIENSNITWILWDERLSSKRAEEIKFGKLTTEEKKKTHAIAAAFILQTYLDYRSMQ